MKPITVSKLNSYVAAIVKEDAFLSGVCVQGELSNVSRSPAGHIYFSLKDDQAVLKCTIWASAAMRLNFVPKDGMKVLAYGACSFYEKGGSFQLNCTKIEQDGIGRLYEEFEKLKKKLAAEGYFDAAHKKVLPFLPKAIGVCTSEGGAAIHDIESTIGRRFPGMPVILYNCPVQGSDAPPKIIDALKRAEAEGKCDVIIVGRGGGSIEDLWAFNDENLAKAIYDCNVPVISAVGHEVDFSISDFVADLRAETPTAAAERAVPVKSELLSKLNDIKKRMQLFPQTIINTRHMDLDSKSKELSGLLVLRAKRESEKLANIRMALARFNLAKQIADRKSNLNNLNLRFNNAAVNFIEKRKSELMLNSEKLRTLGPEAVLSRGYAALFDETGKPLTKTTQVNAGEIFTVKMQDGSIDAKRVH